MNSIAMLERALALIERPENWCQGAATRGDARCAAGALATAAKRVVKPHEATSRALIKAAGGCGYVYFNDHHSHAEVVALFQEAIRNEKQRLGVELDVPQPAERANSTERVAA